MAIGKLILLKAIVNSMMLILGLHFFVYSQLKQNLPSDDKEAVRTDINYCNLELSNTWKLANIKFDLMYTFKVSEKGEIIQIKKLRDDFVGEEKVKACINNWRIFGFLENAEFVVSFKWQHSKGWFEQVIFGKEFKQTMNRENVGINKLVISKSSKRPLIKK